MRIKRIILEHHCDVAILGMDVVDALAADIDLALGDRFESCDHSEERGLAAARGAEKHDERAVLDIKVDAVDDFDLAI